MQCGPAEVDLQRALSLVFQAEHQVALGGGGGAQVDGLELGAGGAGVLLWGGAGHKAAREQGGGGKKGGQKGASSHTHSFREGMRGEGKHLHQG
ncbi:hypothetical protein DV096_06305 [Bradymonadaceae bacterium TMQ3]|nr:hypothetical protein DV096_06305 [Bradymonadaceae bacterium TMQ3]